MHTFRPVDPLCTQFYKNLRKTLYLQLDVLKFYKIYSILCKIDFYIHKYTNSASTPDQRIYKSTTILSKNSTFYNFFL